MAETMGSGRQPMARQFADGAHFADRARDTLAAWADNPALAGGRAADLANSFLQMGDKERGAILSTVARALKWTAAQHMRAFLGSDSGFRLDMLLQGDTDLFIVVPLDQVGPQAGFLRLLTNELLALMVQQDGRGEAADTVLFVADEFTRLGFMQRVVDIATVAAGMKLETIFVLQDRGSLEAVYGQYAVDTILGSCATVRVFNLGRGDLRTARWLSEVSGYKTIISEGRTVHQAGGNHTRTQSETRENLLSVSDLLELPTDQTVCLIRGKPPAKMKRIKWYSHPLYRASE